MKRYTQSARIWIISTIVAAAIVTALLVRPFPVTRAEWFTLVVLGVSAAIAHFFPVRSTTRQATYSLTNVFIIAGAIVLPTPLLCVLVVVALTPQSWRGQHRPSMIARWSFNIAQTLLAAYAAHSIVAVIVVRDLHSPIDAVAITGSALLFVVVQNLIVATAVTCNTRVPLWRTDIVQPMALVTEGCFGVLGILVVVLWLSMPWLLLLVIPLLFIAHALTRAAQMATLAMIDTKTGLPNARSFEQTLEAAQQRAARTERSFAILFFDLDHFKRINDTYGHAVGDIVLREFGTLMQATLRREDSIARFGGEEFIALLPDIGADHANILAERLRDVVERHHFLRERSDAITCTVSIGVAMYPQDGTDAATLLDYADRAMYQAKRTRNATYIGDYVRPIAQMPSAPAHTIDTSRHDRPRLGFPAMPSLVLWSTVCCGVTALGIALFTVWRENAWLVALPCIIVGALSDLFPVRLYTAKQEKMTVTLTDAAMMALVTIQPLAAPLVNVAAALVHVIVGRQRRLDKVLFNLTNPGLAAGLAGFVYLHTRPDRTGFTVQHLVAALASSVVFVIANSGIVVLMISMHSRRPLRTVVRELFWYAPITLLLALTGAFIGAVAHQLGVMGVVMFAIPLVLMRITLGFSAKKNQNAIETLEEAKINLEKAHEEKTKTLRQLIETVSNIIDARDNLVWGHSRKVADYAVQIGKELGLSVDEQSAIHSAGLLHDLGKVAIPERILHKPGRLTDEEFSVVKEHPMTGKRILAEVEMLNAVAVMVGDHHERFDGNGYPHRREGEEISIGGRILSVADTLDSILSDRTYSGARPLSVALAEIGRCSGTQFDPLVVAALHRVVAAKGEAYFTNSALDVAMRKAEPMMPQVIAFPKSAPAHREQIAQR